MENATATVVEKGWSQSISSALRVDWLEQRMHLPQGKLVEFTVFFAGGLLIGYLAKKYAKLILACACFLLLLIILQQFNFITIGINWAKLQSLPSTATSAHAGLLTVYWEWVKAHVGVVLSFAIGFLAGFKIG